MNLKKSGGGNRVKAVMVASMLATSVVLATVPSVGSHKESTLKDGQELEEALWKVRIERVNQEIKEEEIAEEWVTNVLREQKKREEEKLERERMKNYTYRKTKELKEKTGLNVVGFQEYTFELSFYSDLNIENGYGNLTANGERLSAGMIANNFLPFNTKVYINGYGTKRVTDRGSKRYFNAVNKADVFIPRNYGESDSAYYKRVNNMGRKHVKGYILKLE